MTSVALAATSARIRASALLPALAVAAVVLVAWWASAPYVVGVFHDDGVYVLLAKAIATGQGFHYIGLPGTPAATHYPPLYPLLLAAAWRIAPAFPDNLGVLLGLNALLAGIAALGLYRFVRTRLAWTDASAALLAVVTMVSAPVLALTSTLLSETLFLAALWPTLLLAEELVDSDERRTAIAAGVAIGLLMLVRAHAVAVLGALVLVLLRDRRWRSTLLVVAFAGAVVLPWQLWAALGAPRVTGLLAGAYGSYGGWLLTGLREGGFAFVVATVRANAVECWLLLQDRVVLGSFVWLRLLCTTLALGLCVAGAFVGASVNAARLRVTVAFLGFYLAIVLVWPFTPWRFVWGVWPVVLLLAAVGGRHIWRRARHGRAQWVAALAVALPIVAMTRTELDALASRTWLAPAHDAGAQIAPVAAWVARHTRPQDVVLTEGEPVIALFTGRRAAPNAAFTAREYVHAPSAAAVQANLRTLLRETPASHVVALTPATRAAARAIAADHGGLRPVAAVGSSEVYEVRR